LAAELEHEIDEHQSIEGCCAKKALHWSYSFYCY
jgi:hypothetical protein